MFMGHYATALVPYELNRQNNAAPFWLYLFAAQFLDFLMVSLVAADIESFAPKYFIDAAFNTMQTNMFVSHDILPAVGWTLLIAAFAWLITRKAKVAAACAALVVFHEACDLVVGFDHNILGQDTATVGFALYTHAPALGMWIEAALCAGILFWFARQRQQSGEALPTWLVVALGAILIGGTLATLPLATTPLSALLG